MIFECFTATLRGLTGAADRPRSRGSPFPQDLLNQSNQILPSRSLGRNRNQTASQRRKRDESAAATLSSTLFLGWWQPPRRGGTTPGTPRARRRLLLQLALVQHHQSPEAVGFDELRGEPCQLLAWHRPRPQCRCQTLPAVVWFEPKIKPWTRPQPSRFEHEARESLRHHHQPLLLRGR